jgi:Tol biopolymer transport system component
MRISIVPKNRSKSTCVRKFFTRPYHLFFLLIFSLFSSIFLLHAQDFQANHPELIWETIETEHFLVHYHQGTVRTANAVAEIAEDIYPHVTGLYQYEPGGKVEFIIKDTQDYANGAAYFFDNKIEIWSENLDYILRGTHNWLRDVITHEYTHIISLQKALKFPRRLPVGWFQAFGYEEGRRPDVVRGFPDVIVSYPFAGITVPVWFAEGVCQYQTEPKKFDYRDSHREMILRDRVKTGNLFSFDKMSTFGKNSIGNESSYNQGFSFVKYLSGQYGDTVVAKLAARAGSPTTVSFKSVIKKVTGVAGEDLHRQWHEHLKTAYSLRLKRIEANLQIGEAFVEEGIGNLHPVVSPDGKKVAYSATGSADYLSQNKLLVQNLETGEITAVTEKVTGSLSWSPDGRYLAYAKVTPVRSTYSLFNDLYIYDLEEEKEYRITRALRARHPDWSHDGARLAFIVESDGLTNLYVLDLGNLQETLKQKEWHERFYNINDHKVVETPELNGDEPQRLNYREVGFKGEKLTQLTRFVNGRQIYHPRWSPNDDYIIFDTSVEFGRDIAKIPLSGGEMSFVLNRRYDERYPAFHPRTGELLYTSDETGIFNIYSLNLETGEKRAYTNVVGGAFMPSMTPDGALFYALYINQGYKIYKINPPQPVPAEQLAYLENYENRIPNLSPEQYDQNLEEPLPAQPYKNRFSGVFFMPRVLLDYGTLKVGTYLYTTEILEKMLFFGGFDVNARKDYDIFAIFEYNMFKPTIFIEAFNQVQNVKENARIEGYNATPEIDVNFNLLQANAGLRGNILPWLFRDMFYARLEYIYSHYRAKIGSFPLTDPASGETFIFAPLRYTYLRGHTLSLYLRHENVKRDLDRDINPRRGRYIGFRYQREWNQFLRDFAADRVVGIETFDKYNFDRLELNWEEYFRVPFTQRHTLTLRFQGGWIDAPVDSFFHFFAGGLPGLKGYNYYSLEGRKKMIGSLTYRFPLLRNINKQIFNIYFDKVYLGAFYQYGNAWVEDKLDFNDFLSNAGVQLRLDTFSWYFFPTRIFVEAVYPFQDHFNAGTYFPQEWKIYFGVLFDFDLRFEKRLF